MNIELEVETIKPEPIEIHILDSENVQQYSPVIEIGDIKLENGESHRGTDEDPLSPDNDKMPEYEVPLNSDHVQFEKLDTGVPGQTNDIEKRSSDLTTDSTVSKSLPLQQSFDTSPWDIEWGADSNYEPPQMGFKVWASDMAPGSTRSRRPRGSRALRPGKRIAVHRSEMDEADDPSFSPFETPLRQKKRKRTSPEPPVPHAGPSTAAVELSLESLGSDSGSPVGASPSRPAIGELLNYEMEPRLRATADQFVLLVEFMERHGDMSRPSQGLQGRLRADRLWKKLTDTLNSVRGGVEKAPEKWRKVWADMKAKTKKKEMIRRYASSTSGPPNNKNLTKLEEKVLSIMGLLLANEQRTEEQGVHTQPPKPSPPGDGIQPVEPGTSPPPPPADNDMLGAECGDVDQEEHRVSPTPSISQENPPTPPQSSTQSRPRSPLRRRLLRRPAQTPFDHRIRDFVAVEMRKVKLDELRERNLHERESERLRVESRKIELGMEIKEVLVRLVGIAERVLDTMS